MDEEMAEEVMRTLGQLPRYDLTGGQFAMTVPEYLVGTPTGELLATMQQEANAVGLYVRRDWKGLRWGGIATYSAWQGNQMFACVSVSGPEGQTPRSKAYKALKTVARAIQDAARQVVENDNVPTVPFYGDYVLTEAQTEQVLELGAFYKTANCTWYSPAATAAGVKKLLEPRRSVRVRPYQDRATQYDVHIYCTIPREDRRSVSIQLGPAHYDNQEFVVAHHEATLLATFGLSEVRKHQSPLQGVLPVGAKVS